MARTASLPGVGEEIPELTVMAQKYIERRDERQAALKREVDLKNQLIATMKYFKRRSYFDEEANISITLDSKTSIKVKVGDSDEEEDE